MYIIINLKYIYNVHTFNSQCFKVRVREILNIIELPTEKKKKHLRGARFVTEN